MVAEPLAKGSYPTSDFTAGSNFEGLEKKLNSQTGPMVCGQLPSQEGRV